MNLTAESPPTNGEAGLGCWQRHGSARLAHHILRLRALGWPIRTDEIDAPTSDGRIARIGKYSLNTGPINLDGERCRKFIAEVAATVTRRESCQGVNHG